MLLKGVYENRALSLIFEDFHQPLSDFFPQGTMMMIFLQEQNQGSFDVKWYLHSSDSVRWGWGSWLHRVTWSALLWSVPSIMEQLVLKLRLGQQLLSFLQRWSEVSEVPCEWKLTHFLCLASHYCPGLEGILRGISLEQRYLTDTGQWFALLAKGQLIGNPVIFRCISPWLLPFAVFSATKKVIGSIFKSSPATRICEPPLLLYSGL